MAGLKIVAGYVVANGLPKLLELEKFTGVKLNANSVIGFFLFVSALRQQ